MGLIQKLKVDPKITHQNLKRFSSEGDSLIKKAPDVIRFLEENGFIQYCRVTLNSLSALLKGKSESFTVDHYHWTPFGNQVYARLEQKYS